MTEQELMDKVAALGTIDENARNGVICALIGHSKIQTTTWGYYNCGRCGADVGDTLAGTYKPTDVVVVGHNCPTCRDLYEAMGWEHKLYAQDPFAKVE